MPQELQEEAQPKKNKMDQSVQKGIRKGADSGKLFINEDHLVVHLFD